MNFVVIGTNHRYSPVELREKLSLSGKRRKDALGILAGRGALGGAVILSTCNRVEIYAAAECPDRAEKDLAAFVSEYSGIKKSGLAGRLYAFRGKEAVNHLFRVAAGLDSQLLGERQVLGQVRDALEDARISGSINEAMIKIFNSAVEFAKEIHRKTGLSSGKVSLGSVAIDFIKGRVGPLENKKILIIGAGKVSGLVLKYLKEEKPNLLFVSNRTYGRAREMASGTGGRAVRFDDLPGHFRDADVVVSATASPHFVIRKKLLEGACGNVLMLDLALPRDIEPSVKDLKNVSLYTLKDLDELIDRNMGNRIKESKKAGKMINMEADAFWKDITGSAREPALSP